MGDTGRITHRFFPTVDTDIKVTDNRLTQVYTAHGKFPFYLHRFKLSDSPLCICGELGDWQHYLTSCDLTKRWHLPPLTILNERLWYRQITANKGQQQKIKCIVDWLKANIGDVINII